KAALEGLSGHSQALRALNSTNSGYTLPPPDLFINTGNENIATALYRNWAKLRKIFIYRLLRSSDHYSKKQWRQFLMLDDEKKVRTDTQTGQRRIETQKILKDILGTSQFHVDTHRSAPVSYRDNVLDRLKMPPPEVIWEMLWELYELNFRQDLVALDNHLDESGMNPSARCTALDTCWFG
ncbi:hypothetical protein L218DRAFT_845683, partial [Marasmius fiardii PR-910]